MDKIGGIRTKSLVPELLVNIGCSKRYQMNVMTNEIIFK